MSNVHLVIMEKAKLNATEKEFFRMVRLAIGANPFSDERAAIDSRLTGNRAPLDARKLVQLLTKVVAEQLDKTCSGMTKPVLQFRGEDRELVQYGILFHIYHKTCDRLDQHIREQIKNGEAPCRVDFADDVLAEMAAMGIARNEAVRFFSLFFQMRRAFYFIDQIVGKSPCMKNLRRNLWNNIFTHDIWLYDQYLWNRMEDFSTMLLGATGTGKGLAAAAIGRSGYIPYDERKKCFSESFTQVFVAINLSQYPEQLVESELFGHKKGAFTGAIDGHEGIFALCRPSGAIFLDEIGEVSIPIQIKLLQVLQERVFSPVGCHRKERFSGRVIAATNRSVDELRRNKMFRDDFYYRLCSDIIHVPSLSRRIKENPDELDDLLAHTVGRIIGKASPELVLSTLKILRQQIPPDYPWPGNVRELEQCVRRILLKRQYEGDTILTEKPETGAFEKILAEGNLTAQELVGRYCKILYEKFGTFEAVAKQTGLDRRTAKKYIES